MIFTLLLHIKKTYLCQKFKTLNQPISITAIASISPLGTSQSNIWRNYHSENHFFSEKQFNHDKVLVAEILTEAKNKIEQLRLSDNKYKSLDDSVLFAIYASRNAIKDAGWKPQDNFGINIGSSRGATALFENYHEEFLKKGKTNPLSSPTTTLGNISSWVAHDLQTNGPEISHSITCSTALHAMLNGVAWINSGMSNKFLVGGSEAPLTAFTVAQMQALKIYSKSKDDYPCRALDLNKNRNSMILGEGAATACLEQGKTKNAIAIIENIGYATEVLEHNASLSTNAECFQRSMSMAMDNIPLEEVDIIVTHTPGTIKGDEAELNAIKHVFGKNPPALTTNKWKFGHTFGASGLFSIEMAILMLQNQQFIPVPFLNQDAPKRINKVLVNAVGFGGNAVSILLSK